MNHVPEAAAPTLEEPSSSAGTVDGAVLPICTERGVGIGAPDPSTVLLLAQALFKFHTIAKLCIPYLAIACTPACEVNAFIN